MRSLLLTIVLCSAACAGAYAQGCQQCKSSAEAAGAQTQSALRKGIVVMLAPTLVVIAGIAWVAYRNRRPHAGVERGFPRGI